MNHRLVEQEYFMAITQLVAMRSTCVRRRVGCVLVDNHRHILSTGYNGVPRGHKHCIDFPCDGAHFPSGQGLSSCEAVHAEQNALLQCSNVEQISFAYCTVAPCIHCAKMLLNTGVHTIYYLHNYAHEESHELLKKNGRLLRRVDLPFNVNLHNFLDNRASYGLGD